MPGEARLEVEVRVPGARAPRLEVRFMVGPGVTAVCGPSGAGKSTLLSCIAGLVRPDSGRVVLGDEVLFDAAARVDVPAHRRRVGLVFQSLALFPHLGAVENVAWAVPERSRTARLERAVAWLQRMRVAHVGDRAPDTLSGGEAQRVALARALAAEPRALLLDEPFSALDASLRAELGQEVAAVVGSLGLPTLLVTHDERDAARLAGRVLRLEAGRLL